MVLNEWASCPSLWPYRFSMNVGQLLLIFDFKTVSVNMANGERLEDNGFLQK